MQVFGFHRLQGANMSEKETQDQLAKIAELDARIRADIAEYNRLSSLANTEQRLALMIAESYLEDERDEDDESEPLTHDEYMAMGECPPNPRIRTFGAAAWFPSSICIGY